jgi:hypothetical protein
LPLISKAANDQSGVVSLANQLDGNLFLELIVGSRATIDFAHPAAAQLRN